MNLSKILKPKNKLKSLIPKPKLPIPKGKAFKMLWKMLNNKSS